MPHEAHPGWMGIRPEDFSYTPGPEGPSQSSVHDG